MFFWNKYFKNITLPFTNFQYFIFNLLESNPQYEDQQDQQDQQGQQDPTDYQAGNEEGWHHQASWQSYKNVYAIFAFLSKENLERHFYRTDTTWIEFLCKFSFLSSYYEEKVCPIVFCLICPKIQPKFNITISPNVPLIQALISCFSPEAPLSIFQKNSDKKIVPNRCSKTSFPHQWIQTNSNSQRDN